MMEASIGISVFLEDGASYDKAMGIFLNRGMVFSPKVRAIIP